jgi:Transposase DDE domain
MGQEVYSVLIKKNVFISYMNLDVIKKFKMCLYTSIEKINNSIGTRSDSQIFFRDILYYSSLIIGNNQSYNIINTQLKINNILNVSKNALVKQKNNLEYNHIDTLNNDLLNYIYESNNPRIIAVDGTYITLLKKFEKYGFTTSKNDDYCIALLSTIFDISMEMPINYFLLKNKNERAGLINQLEYLKKNDIVIMDRGYFSYDLLYTLTQKKIRVIFRLRHNMIILNELHTRNEHIVNIDYDDDTIIPLRVVKYTIDGNLYYLGTTIYNRSINYLKNLYWKRWKIETHFRYSKYNLSLKQLDSKSENTLRQDICLHNFIFIISSYFQYLLQFNIRDDYKINTTNHLYVVINNLLYILLYNNNGKKTITEINEILNIVEQSVIPIRENITHDRIKKRPSSKWCRIGNLYKFIH